MIRAIGRGLAQLSLEEYLCDEDLAGLVASQHQRLACMAIQGGAVPDVSELCGWGPEIAERSGRRYMVGDVKRVERPMTVYLLSGIRTGKSLTVAAAALRAAMTCDVGMLRRGEVPRVSVLSLRRDLAAVIREHLAGIVAGSPMVGQLVTRIDADSVYLAHPSGIEVEVRVVAGAKAGSAVVARWSAGVIVDEAPRFAGADEGVINLEDLLSAARGRLLPGAQVLLIGSPWAARGPVYDAVQEHWHRPSSEVLVMRAAAPALNPVWWTPGRVRELQESNPTAYTADVLGEFVELATDALPSHDIDACRGDYLQLSADRGMVHVAAIDPALRLNAWTLVVMRERPDKTQEVALARQWMPQSGRSLDPEAVMAEIATALAPYGVTTLYSDQHLIQTLQHVARGRGLSIVQVDLRQYQKCQLIGDLAAKLALRRVRLPDNAQLVDDLRRVRRVATSGRTGLRIELPSTADGRHCDYVPSIMLCLAHMQPAAPEPTADEDGYEALVAKHRKRNRHGRVAQGSTAELRRIVRRLGR